MLRSPAFAAIRTTTIAAAVAVAVLFLSGFPAVAEAHHGYRHHHSGATVGFYASRGYYGGHRGHRGYRSGVSFAWSGPLYVAPAPAVVQTVQPAVIVRETSRARRTLPDMPVLQYQALQGQDAQQVTLDRRRCERESWRATRPDPVRGTFQERRSVRYVETRQYPGSPLPSAASGALLGAVGGAIGGDAGLGAAIGAAVGATSWLIGSAQATVVSVPREVVERRYVPPPGPDAQALRTTLMACMEARGYAVR